MLMDSADVVLISTSAFVIVLIGSPCDGTGGGVVQKKDIASTFSTSYFLQNTRCFLQNSSLI